MQEKFKKTGLVVSDASCFIILQKIDALNLLPELFSDVVTTPEIAEEYKLPLPPWVIIRAPKNLSRQEDINQYIDLGEASAIALSLEIKPDFLRINLSKSGTV